MKRSALLAIICLAACDEADVPLDQCSHAAAYERAKTEMTNLLKSPGSAIYPAASKPGFISDAGVIVTKRAEPCTFGISSHVDSQNAFGALIRTKFSTTLEWKAGQNRWVVKEFLHAPN